MSGDLQRERRGDLKQGVEVRAFLLDPSPLTRWPLAV